MYMYIGMLQAYLLNAVKAQLYQLTSLKYACA